MGSREAVPKSASNATASVILHANARRMQNVAIVAMARAISPRIASRVRRRRLATTATSRGTLLGHVRKPEEWIEVAGRRATNAINQVTCSGTVLIHPRRVTRATNRGTLAATVT